MLARRLFAIAPHRGLVARPPGLCPLAPARRLSYNGATPPLGAAPGSARTVVAVEQGRNS